MDTAGHSVSLAQQTANQQTAPGFAIPIDTALSMARQIAAGHASSRVTVGYPPFIGIFTGGGSPAAAAGITAGSVITAVNSMPVTSPDDLTSILARFRPGTTISVTWTSPAGKQTTQPPAPDRRPAPVTTR